MLGKKQHDKKQIQTWNIMAESQACKDSTHPDEYLATLELEFIQSRVKGKVLTVGCGSGNETNECVKKTGIPAIGVDFSEKMITLAKKRFPCLDFTVANVLRLPFPDASFDSVTTRRTLINLLTHSDQVKAIEEMKRVLRPSGNLIMIEATGEGYDRLNKLRSECNLDEVHIVEYNLPLREEDIINFLPGCEISHLDTYYYLTRIYYPLIEKKIQYNTQYHKSAYLLHKKGDISIKCSPHILVYWCK
jgi:ubiquinone/menaquinone biosynthesis C-methylase UbiE